MKKSQHMAWNGRNVDQTFQCASWSVQNCALFWLIFFFKTFLTIIYYYPILNDGHIQPGWERNLGKKGYIYICMGWIPSLFTYHNIINQLYPNRKQQV